MSDFWADYHARQDKLRVATETNKASIFAAMSAGGVERVTVTYSGYGDSGQIDEIDDVPDINLPFIDTHHGTWVGGKQPEATTRIVKLADAMRDICYHYLSLHHGGWEINEGSSGSFVFDAKTKQIHLDHGENVTEVVHHESIL